MQLSSVLARFFPSLRSASAPSSNSNANQGLTQLSTPDFRSVMSHLAQHSATNQASSDVVMGSVSSTSTLHSANDTSLDTNFAALNQQVHIDLKELSNEFNALSPSDKAQLLQLLSPGQNSTQDAHAALSALLSGLQLGAAPVPETSQNPASTATVAPQLSQSGVDSENPLIALLALLSQTSNLSANNGVTANQPTLPTTQILKPDTSSSSAFLDQMQLRNELSGMSINLKAADDNLAGNSSKNKTMSATVNPKTGHRHVKLKSVQPTQTADASLLATNDLNVSAKDSAQNSATGTQTDGSVVNTSQALQAHIQNAVQLVAGPCEVHVVSTKNAQASTYLSLQLQTSPSDSEVATLMQQLATALNTPVSLFAKNTTSFESNTSSSSDTSTPRSGTVTTLQLRVDSAALLGNAQVQMETNGRLVNSMPSTATALEQSKTATMSLNTVVQDDNYSRASASPSPQVPTISTPPANPIATPTADQALSAEVISELSANATKSEYATKSPLSTDVLDATLSLNTNASDGKVIVQAQAEKTVVAPRSGMNDAIVSTPLSAATVNAQNTVVDSATTQIQGVQQSTDSLFTLKKLASDLLEQGIHLSGLNIEINAAPAEANASSTLTPTVDTAQSSLAQATTAQTSPSDSSIFAPSMQYLFSAAETKAPETAQTLSDAHNLATPSAAVNSSLFSNTSQAASSLFAPSLSVAAADAASLFQVVKGVDAAARVLDQYANTFQPSSDASKGNSFVRKEDPAVASLASTPHSIPAAMNAAPVVIDQSTQTIKLSSDVTVAFQQNPTAVIDAASTKGVTETAVANPLLHVPSALQVKQKQSSEAAPRIMNHSANQSETRSKSQTVNPLTVDSAPSSVASAKQSVVSAPNSSTPNIGDTIEGAFKQKQPALESLQGSIVSTGFDAKAESTISASELVNDVKSVPTERAVAADVRVSNSKGVELKGDLSSQSIASTSRPMLQESQPKTVANVAANVVAAARVAESTKHEFVSKGTSETVRTASAPSHVSNVTVAAQAAVDALGGTGIASQNSSQNTTLTNKVPHSVQVQGAEHQLRETLRTQRDQQTRPALSNADVLSDATSTGQSVDAVRASSRPSDEQPAFGEGRSGNSDQSSAQSKAMSEVTSQGVSAATSQVTEFGTNLQHAQSTADGTNANLAPMSAHQQKTFGLTPLEGKVPQRAASEQSADTSQRVYRVPIDNFAPNTTAILKNMNMSQGGSARLILTPDALGTVVVNLNLQESQRSLSIDVASQSAKAAVEAQMPQLREQFASQGVRVDTISVQVRDTEKSSNFNANSQQQHAGQQKQEEREARASFLRSFDQRTSTDADARGRGDSSRQRRARDPQRRQQSQSFEQYA